MGYARKAAAFLTADEYLALETHARTKHEYLEGVIYAWQGQVPESMAGGSRAHHRISLNIATALNMALRGTACAPYMADMRLRVAVAAGRTQSAYFYPDVFVHCGPSQPPEATEIEDPRVIIEVLSPSTEAFDRGVKFAAYRQIDALQEYLLIDPDTRRVEAYRRNERGAFELHDQTGQPTLQLSSVDLVMPMAEVFDGVDNESTTPVDTSAPGGDSATNAGGAAASASD